MQAIPVADCWRARPRLFQLAVCVRLEVPISELDVSGGVACSACGSSRGGFIEHILCEFVGDEGTKQPKATAYLGVSFSGVT